MDHHLNFPALGVACFKATYAVRVHVLTVALGEEAYPSAKVLDIILLHAVAGIVKGQIGNVDHCEVTTCLVIEDIRGLEVAMLQAVLVVGVGEEAAQSLKGLHQLRNLSALHLPIDDISETLSRGLGHHDEIMSVVASMATATKYFQGESEVPVLN